VGFPPQWVVGHLAFVFMEPLQLFPGQNYRQHKSGLSSSFEWQRKSHKNGGIIRIGCELGRGVAEWGVARLINDIKRP